jgi:Ca2+/Na+ antiporter
MLTVAVPLAMGTIGIVLIVVAAILLAALAYSLLTRDNPRQLEEDAEREQIVEQIELREPVDFQADLRPPREP